MERSAWNAVKKKNPKPKRKTRYDRVPRSYGSAVRFSISFTRVDPVELGKKKKKRKRNNPKKNSVKLGKPVAG